MKPWMPIVDASQLPAVGTEESEYLDYKREPWGGTDSSKTELLRDVAQFANHLGGSLIVGAVEADGGLLTQYVDVVEPERLVSRVEQCCYERLSPRVEHELVVVKGHGVSVVVVNVHPSISPIAIRVGDQRWEFYRRNGKSKMPMSFEEVERMWTDGRRGRLLLAKIPEAELKSVYLDVEVCQEAQPYFLFDSPSTITRHLDHFELRLPGGETFNFPYEFVKAVWPRMPAGWFAVLDVKLQMRSNRWVLRMAR